MINTSPFEPNKKGHWEENPETGEMKFIEDKKIYPTTRKTYEAHYTKEGNFIVEETGEIDFQAEIENHRSDSELSELIRRYINGATDTGINTPINYGSEDEKLYDIKLDLNSINETIKKGKTAKENLDQLMKEKEKEKPNEKKEKIE